SLFSVANTGGVIGLEPNCPGSTGFGVRADLTGKGAGSAKEVRSGKLCRRPTPCSRGRPGGDALGGRGPGQGVLPGSPPKNENPGPKNPNPNPNPLPPEGNVGRLRPDRSRPGKLNAGMSSPGKSNAGRFDSPSADRSSPGKSNAGRLKPGKSN